jgi:hypothetical protein
MIVLGCAMVLWAGWFMPREFSRVRSRIAQRGNPTQRFDDMLQSRSYRLTLAVGLIGGVVLIITGVVLAIIGE